ncbi:AraC family transcriptional regulator [Xanthobacter sp. DSM 24535]|uniref:helix-turn-helix domain-containing protein n=1 Tax=Roseixanthobacter psychrophilus TaxID=3119917 RepID=UPI00372C4E7E
MDAIVASDEPSSPPAAPERTSPIGLEAYISGTTLVSSDGPAWKDVFVQLFSRNRIQASFLVPAVAEPLIVWVMSGEVIVEERDLGGDWSASRVEAGDFFLTRSPAPYEMRWRAESDQPFKVMHLYLAVPLFERVAREMLGTAKIVGLKDISGGRDTTLSHILSLFHGALINEGAADALFIEGLAQSLAAHLVRQYAASGPVARPSNALPGSKLRLATTFMEAHLAEPFDLKCLAQAVGMSEFHFSRLFKKATGLSPSLYFIRQRVAKAQQLLQETGASVIEIGMAVGYSSPSHFAQIFRRETGVSPSGYRGA